VEELKGVAQFRSDSILSFLSM